MRTRTILMLTYWFPCSPKTRLDETTQPSWIECLSSFIVVLAGVVWQDRRAWEKFHYNLLLAKLLSWTLSFIRKHFSHCQLSLSTLVPPTQLFIIHSDTTSTSLTLFFPELYRSLGRALCGVEKAENRKSKKSTLKRLLNKRWEVGKSYAWKSLCSHTAWKAGIMCRPIQLSCFLRNWISLSTYLETDKNEASVNSQWDNRSIIRHFYWTYF